MFKKNSANSLDRQIWSSLTLVLANLYNLNALKQSFCKFFKVAWLGHNAILSQGRGCVLGGREEGHSSIIWGDVTVVVKSLNTPYLKSLNFKIKIQCLHEKFLDSWSKKGFEPCELWNANTVTCLPMSKYCGVNSVSKKLKPSRI